MIKFFRQIRYKLMSQNQTSRYFKYAIGEILLVVIGILIALQINNWNEERKISKSERSMLLDIRNDLVESRIELNDVAEYNKRREKSIKMVIDYLEKDLPYSKSLDTAFFGLRYWSSPYLTFTAYETLKTKGIDLIKNDRLKKSIISLYESDFAYVIKDYDRTEWVLAQNIVYPLTIKNIKKIDNATARPNDYEALKENVEFVNMLNELKHIRLNGIKLMQTVSMRTQEVINSIDQELDEG